MQKHFFPVLASIFLCFTVAAQENVLDKNDLVQFSGVIVTADSLNPVPYASIMIKNTIRGTVSDYFGFFSFVAKMKDTIEFSAIGFKRAIFVIPDTLTDQRCSLIQMLKPDTVLLKEVVIFPWPTKEQFKEAFLNLHVPDDDLSRAKNNLNSDRIAFLTAVMPMDGSMNYRYSMLHENTRLYYSGQLPTTNLLNPIAWAKFVQMWQNGDFKKKDKVIKNED